MDAAPERSAAPRVWRVSDLNRRVRGLLDADPALTDVWVEGEVSQPSFPPSGHCFFTLKDAHSQIRAVLFREELARAVRTESAQAIGAWWGVSEGVVWRWRKALGVDGPAGTRGSRLAITGAARKGAEAVKQREFTEEERQAKREMALRLNLGRHAAASPKVNAWTAEELALLADPTLSNSEIALRIGRSWRAVWQKRRRLGLA